MPAPYFSTLLSAIASATADGNIPIRCFLSFVGNLSSNLWKNDFVIHDFVKLFGCGDAALLSFVVN